MIWTFAVSVDIRFEHKNLKVFDVSSGWGKAFNLLSSLPAVLNPLMKLKTWYDKNASFNKPKDLGFVNFLSVYSLLQHENDDRKVYS